LNAAFTNGSRVIPHLREHFLQVGEAKLAGIVLPERVKLPRGDLVLLDLVRLLEERAHVFDEATTTHGRGALGASSPTRTGIEQRDAESWALKFRRDALPPQKEFSS
jgi:hypothetical protein